MDRLNNVYSARFARRGRLILRHLAGWPARMVAARQAMRQLAGMSDHELRDIGLFRQDLRDATALPLDADPTRLLAARGAVVKFGYRILRVGDGLLLCEGETMHVCVGRDMKKMCLPPKYAERFAAYLIS